MKNVRKLVAIIMAAVFTIFAFAGCGNGSRTIVVSTTEESSEIESDIKSSMKESSEVESLLESFVEESSKEEKSMTEEELQKIKELLPEISDESFLSEGTFSNNDIVCYARSLVDEDNGSYHRDDLFRIIGKYKENYYVFLYSSGIGLINCDEVTILPLDYQPTVSDIIVG